MPSDPSQSIHDALLNGLWERLADQKQHADLLERQIDNMWTTIRNQEDLLKAHLVNERVMMESFEQLKQLHIVLVQQLNEMKSAPAVHEQPERRAEEPTQSYRHRHVYSS